MVGTHSQKNGVSIWMAATGLFILLTFIPAYSSVPVQDGDLTHLAYQHFWPRVTFYEGEAGTGFIPGVYTQISPDLTYNCFTSTCVVPKWTIHYHGDCIFVMQVWRNVTHTSSGQVQYQLIGHNLVHPPRNNFAQGYSYTYDVPVADRLSFSGEVYFGFSQVKPVRGNKWCVVALAADDRNDSSLPGFLTKSLNKTDCVDEIVYFPRKMTRLSFRRRLTFGAFIQHVKPGLVNPGYGSNIQRCLNGTARPQPSTATTHATTTPTTTPTTSAPLTTESTPATMTLVGRTTPATPTAAGTTAGATSDTATTTADFPDSPTPVTSTGEGGLTSSTDPIVDRKLAGQGSAEKSDYLLNIGIPIMAVAVVGILISIVLLLRAWHSRKDPVSWVPAIEPEEGRTSTFPSTDTYTGRNNSSVCSSSLDSRCSIAESTDTMVGASHVATNPLPQTVTMSSENSPAASHRSGSDSVDLVFTATGIVERPYAMPSKQAKFQAQPNLSVTMAGDTPPPLPQYEVVLSIEEVRRLEQMKKTATTTTAYELRPTVSRHIRALAAQYSSMDADCDVAGGCTATATASASNPSTQYDRPLDDVNLFSAIGRPLPHVHPNHEVRAQLRCGQTPTVSASSAVAAGYRLPTDAVRVPNDPISPHDELARQAQRKASSSSQTPLLAMTQHNSRDKPNGYIEPADEPPKPMPVILRGAYFDLDSSKETPSEPLIGQEEQSAPTSPPPSPSGSGDGGSTVDTASMTSGTLAAEPFVPPPDETAALEKLLTMQEIVHFSPSQLHSGDVLGAGEFGVVKLASLTTADKASPTLVAVKELSSKVPITPAMANSFMKEALMLGQFHHRHVIELLGVVRERDQPVQLVMELLTGGDLLTYLRTLGRDRMLAGGELSQKLMQFSIEIACGAQYLAEKNFIHRDLACRNIMLDRNLTCKISDFGLSRKLSDSSFYQSKGGKIPVRWTAPEAMIDNRYSLASDVWSYGIILYEIWSLGKKPYATWCPDEIIEQLVDKQYRLPRPDLCPEYLHLIMRKTWLPWPHERPTFKVLIKCLTTFSQRHQQALEEVPAATAAPATETTAAAANAAEVKRSESEQEAC